MQHSSEFPGLSSDDYDNVLALNKAFLDVSTSLKGPQKGRLASAPFLLFSLRENDLRWWQDALAAGPQISLLRSPDLATDNVRALQSAGIGFLWQLARRNAYAVRILTGSSVAWCDLLLRQSLITLLERVGTRGDLMQSRLDDRYGKDDKFLTGGASSRKQVRRSSHIVALQSMLTSNRAKTATRQSAAACNLSIPNESVAAASLRRVSEKKV